MVLEASVDPGADKAFGQRHADLWSSCTASLAELNRTTGCVWGRDWFEVGRTV
jgi:hypothetical protein